MLQFYFLSVLLNVVTGFILVYSATKTPLRENPLDEDDFYSEIEKDDDDPFSDSDDEKPLKKKAQDAFSVFISEPIFLLVLGMVSFFVGIIKFAYTQDGVPFIGDFLTALAGVVSGICLILSWLDTRDDLGIVLPSFFDIFLGDVRKFIGFFCIAAGVIHFIVPRLLFL